MLTRAFLDKIVLDLFTRNYMPLSHIDGKFQGYPITDSFICYISPRLQEETTKLAGFIDRSYYPDPHYPDLPKNEIGCIGNFRIVIDDRMDPSKIKVDCIARVEFNID